MGRESKSDPFPPMPTASEQRRFARHGLGGPTLKEFRVLVTGLNSACSWNQQAALIAAQNYVSQPDALTKDTESVKEAILTHFRSLAAQYKKIQCKTLDSEDEEYVQVEERKEENKKKTRRREVGPSFYFQLLVLTSSLLCS